MCRRTDTKDGVLPSAWEWGEEHSQVARGEQSNGEDQGIEKEGRGQEERL